MTHDIKLYCVATVMQCTPYTRQQNWLCVCIMHMKFMLLCTVGNFWKITSNSFNNLFTSCQECLRVEGHCHQLLSYMHYMRECKDKSCRASNFNLQLTSPYTQRLSAFYIGWTCKRVHASHSGVVEDSCLMACDTVSLGSYSSEGMRYIRNVASQ
jgi:hypothetical protein